MGIVARTPSMAMFRKVVVAIFAAVLAHYTCVQAQGKLILWLKLHVYILR